MPPLLAVLLLAISLSISGCVRRSFDRQANLTRSDSGMQQVSSPRININTAPADELEKLPGIGKAMAARIIEHREKYGPYRKPEHLIIVRGISDRRFHALQNLITVE